MKPIRVLALMEATSITGPAKNLLEYAGLCTTTSPAVEMHIATIRRPHHPSQDPFIDALRTQGIPHTILRENSAFDFTLLRSLRELAHTLQPDIFQTHNVKSNFLTSLSGIHRHHTWVAWHHGYTQPTTKQHLYNQLDRISLPMARRVVTVTNAFLGELLRIGVSRNHIDVIPNAIRPRAAVAPIPHPGVPTSRLLVSVGRLSKEKDHAALIEAAATLPNVHVLIVGEGHERQNLTQLAARRNVALTLAGQVNDVGPYLAAATLFVMPSLSEGSPNALIEAMAAGLPIVSTTAGGIPETATSGIHALLVAPGNVPALSQAIAELLENPDLAGRIAAAAMQRANSDFAPAARAEAICSLYERLLPFTEKKTI